MEPTFWTPTEYHANLTRPLGHVTNAMERTGAVVDTAKLAAIGSQARADSERIEGDLRAWAGRDVNFLSWQQLAAFLHTDETGLRLDPSPYWKKGEVDIDQGEIKTDDRALEWLAGHNAAHRENINKIRELRKHRRTANYAEDWLEKAVRHADGTSRLHPCFGLGSDHDTRPGAKTGRFAVKNPPLNQVPKAGEGPLGQLRTAFVPPPGYRLVVVDYSQLEIVILAHLIAALFGFSDPLVARVQAGKDIHGPLARTVFGELGGDPFVAGAADADFKEHKLLKMLRNLAKAGIYGNNYGKSEPSFAVSLFLPDGSPLGTERAKLLCSGLRVAYPGIFKYQDFIRAHIEAGCSITSLFGRLMWLLGARARKQGDRNKAWRQALNFPMQAGGQEIMALALLSIFADPKLRELGFDLSLIVHDEIVGWAPESTADECLSLVSHHMVSTVQLLVPLMVEGHTGLNWGVCK